jgi:4-diphosphocytidyl-2-C-methyl-D-erythritol kinase
VITVKAPAKINLTLEVLGKRPDGYHEIKSLMQTIGLFDVLHFETAESLTLDCSDRSLQSKDNLVFRAAELLRKTAVYRGGTAIHLEKHIPVSAGLGGGSSDAAAALLGLNRLWKCKLGREQLAELAAQIGSDVPFFIYGGAALVEGRGEKITPLKARLKLENKFIVFQPDFQEVEGKTGKLYSLLTPDMYSDGSRTAAAVDSLVKTGDIPENLLFNTFDLVADVAYPGMETYRKTLIEAGATNIHLCGSGPCLFEMAAIHHKFNRLIKKGYRIIPANSL